MEKSENSNLKNSITAIAVVGLIIVSIFGLYKAGGSWGLFSLSNQTPSELQPIKTSMSFSVYDANTNTFLGSVGPGQTWSGGMKYPDIDCFNSQCFFVDSSGRPVSKPVLDTEHVVVDGVDLIATGTFYGIDVGSRTHVDLGAVAAGEQTKFGAIVSPLYGQYWSASGQGIGSHTLADTVAPGQGVVNHSGVIGSLVFTCDAGNGFNYNWGRNNGGVAQITQSLAPFLYANGSIITDLTQYNYFGQANGANEQGYQLQYVMNHYKVAPVYVKPTVSLVAQTAPVWSSYTTHSTLPNGTVVEVNVNLTGAVSGFRAAYPANLTQYDQAGQITNNLYKSITTNMTKVPGGTNSSLTSNTPSNGVTPTISSISGSLIYNGPEKLADGSKYQPAVAGIASMAENLNTNGLNEKDYHFTIKNLSSISSMPNTATLSSEFTLQPAATISWADEICTSQYYVWDGNSWNQFYLTPSQSSVHIYYPFSISCQNMYVIQRWVIEVWTLSKYSLTLMAAGSPINGKLLSDAELTILANEPGIDDKTQWVPIPTATDWVSIVIWIAVVVIAVIIIVAIINARSRQTRIEIHMEEGHERKYRG